MPTVIELAAKLNREAAEAMARSANVMPDDKVVWKPLDAGRTTLDQIQECGGINFSGAQILQTRSVPPFDDAARQRFEQMKAENDTLEKALALLKAGTDSLVA